MKSVWISLALVLALRPAWAFAEAPCAEGSPHLVMETTRGTMVVRLLEDAAPGAVRRLARLAEGPVFAEEIFAGQDEVPRVGYWDGLHFGHTQPHVEIITDVRPPGDLVEIETELDAVPLGLDEQRVADPGEAMDIAQFELVPTYKGRLRSGKIHPRLREWVDRLHRSHDAGFLVDVSRQEINEALGYVYQEGLASEPVTRGAVLLHPLSPRWASARLSIVLANIPQRTGRSMVVGRVVEGLAVAQEISVQPLADPALVRSRYRPVDPVRIETVRLDCRRGETPPE